MATIKTATDIKAKARIVPSPFAVIPKADEATDDINPKKEKLQDGQRHETSTRHKEEQEKAKKKKSSL